MTGDVRALALAAQASRIAKFSAVKSFTSLLPPVVMAAGLITSVTLGGSSAITGTTRTYGQYSSNANELSYMPLTKTRGGTVSYYTNGNTAPGSLGLSCLHYGTQIEFQFPSSSAFYLALKVNDQYYSLTPMYIGSGTNILTLVFPSAARRRIELVMAQGSWPNNVLVGANDGLEQAPVRGPKGIVLGDSMTIGNSFIPYALTLTAAPSASTSGTLTSAFTGRTGTYYVTFSTGTVVANVTLTNGSTAISWGTSITASANITANLPAVTPMGFAYLLSDYLRCDDITASGIGGTGYSTRAGGQNNNFLDRYMADVVAPNPDWVLISGGGLINDGGSAQSLTNAQALFAALKSQLPNAQIIVSMLYNNPVASMNTASLAYYKALKAAAQQAGCTYIDLIDLNTGRNFGPATSLSTTLNGAVSAGAGLFYTNSTFYDPHDPYEIGTASNLERVDVTGNGGDKRLTISGSFQNAHVSGEPVVQVGRSLWTGPQNSITYGTCATYVGPDGTHPTLIGDDAIAYSQATRMYGQIYQ
jgi:hypothetical protein